MDRQQISLKLALDAIGRTVALDTFDDRLAIQKAIYLCQAAGVHLGYRYNWYLRGPYSPDLTRDAFALRDGLKTDSDDLKGFKLDADSTAKLSALDSLWSGKIAGGQPRWLELLASVQFLKTSYDGRGKDAASLKAILEKNEKIFSLEEVNEAIRELAKHGFAN